MPDKLRDRAVAIDIFTHTVKTVLVHRVLIQVAHQLFYDNAMHKFTFHFCFFSKFYIQHAAGDVGGTTKTRRTERLQLSSLIGNHAKYPA